MPTRPMTTTAQQLNAAQLAITNSLADPEIKAAVAQYGPHTYSPYPPMLSVLLAPVYWIIRHQGLNYGDRAEQICMNGNFCDHRSYVRRVTHTAYTREPGDA